MDVGFSLFVSDEKKELTSIDVLSKHKLEGLITKINKVIRSKYKKNKEPKYGNINKGFTEAELKHFFSVCRNEKAYLAFFLMSHLGLRIGEVVNIKVEDIDFFKHKIKVFTEKAHTGDFLYMPSQVQKLLYLWVQKFPEKITKSGDFILFSDSPTSGRKNLSADWLRNEFREVCQLAELNEFYANSTKGRRLHRLTTHSLRHYFISKAYRTSKNPLHTQRLARHRSFKSTQTYINISQEDIDKTMQAVFEEEGVKVEDEVADFLKLYETWKKVKR